MPSVANGVDENEVTNWKNVCHILIESPELRFR